MEISVNLKEKIQLLTIEYFKDKESVEISKFNIDVLVKNGIDFKEYVVPAKNTLKSFLMSFPEIFVLTSNGTQYYCQLNKSILKGE